MPPEGFDVAKEPSRQGALWTRRVWRTIAVTALVLLVVVFVQNIRANHRADVAVPQGINADAARTTAAVFASDYLAHDPSAAPATGQAVLARNLTTGGSASGLSFSGTAYLATDLVSPGAVVTKDATHAVVSVQARVTIAMPGNANDAPNPSNVTPAPQPGRTANASTMPNGYSVVATEWLPLQVPVVQADPGSPVQVDVAGPVFSADPAPAASEPAETDSAATEKTREWVKTLFTSYALSSTTGAYLSAPGVDLQGLAGAVTVKDVPSWTLTAPDAADGHRTGTARVTWSFGPTADLTVTQTYTVKTTTSDNRWYTTAIGS